MEIICQNTHSVFSAICLPICRTEQNHLCCKMQSNSCAEPNVTVSKRHLQMGGLQQVWYSGKWHKQLIWYQFLAVWCSQNLTTQKLATEHKQVIYWAKYHCPFIGKGEVRSSILRGSTIFPLFHNTLSALRINQQQGFYPCYSVNVDIWLQLSVKSAQNPRTSFAHNCTKLPSRSIVLMRSGSL